MGIEAGAGIMTLPGPLTGRLQGPGKQRGLDGH